MGGREELAREIVQSLFKDELYRRSDAFSELIDQQYPKNICLANRQHSGQIQIDLDESRSPKEAPYPDAPRTEPFHKHPIHTRLCAYVYLE